MRIAYSVLLYCLLPFILLRLLWRGFKAPAYWQRWAERFGFCPPLAMMPRIWLHAVSVGEVRAALPLIRALQTHYPDYALLITTMTPTGSQHVRETFGNSVEHCYLSYDFSDAVARFLARTQPTMGIILETELWPNVIMGCQQRHIPLLLANARLSARSARAYQRYGGSLLKATLACFQTIAVQAQLDEKRFLTIGATPAQLSMTGNIKFDLNLPAGLKESAEIQRQQWQNRPVWIAASTHEGEEEHILAAFKLVKKQLSTVLLILVPRHPERFQKVARLCEQAHFKICRRSQADFCSPDIDIYLGDTMGELLLLYAASDVAFVGGSLVATGGHNMLEPASLDVPVLFGPHVFNFEDISQGLLQQSAAIQITDANMLADTLIHWLSNAPIRQRYSENARLFVQQNRGALQRLLILIALQLPKKHNKVKFLTRASDDNVLKPYDANDVWNNDTQQTDKTRMIKQKILAELNEEHKAAAQQINQIIAKNTQQEKAENTQNKKGLFSGIFGKK